jgi:hypothetical protein
LEEPAASDFMVDDLSLLVKICVAILAEHAPFSA